MFVYKIQVASNAQTLFNMLISIFNVLTDRILTFCQHTVELILFLCDSSFFNFFFLFMRNKQYFFNFFVTGIDRFFIHV